MHRAPSVSSKWYLKWLPGSAIGILSNQFLSTIPILPHVDCWHCSWAIVVLIPERFSILSAHSIIYTILHAHRFNPDYIFISRLFLCEILDKNFVVDFIAYRTYRYNCGLRGKVGTTVVGIDPEGSGHPPILDRGGMDADIDCNFLVQSLATKFQCKFSTIECYSIKAIYVLSWYSLTIAVWNWLVQRNSTGTALGFSVAETV